MDPGLGTGRWFGSSVVDPNTLNLDPIFWPNLDPGPEK